MNSFLKHSKVFTLEGLYHSKTFGDIFTNNLILDWFLFKRDVKGHKRKFFINEDSINTGIPIKIFNIFIKVFLTFWYPYKLLEKLVLGT